MTDFEKGARVVLTEEGRYGYATGWGSRFIRKGSAGVVTSQAKYQVVSVKFDGEDSVVRVPLGLLAPEDINAPRPRRLGEPPDGMLSPLDPRLSWLWDDAAKMANQKGLCSQYDSFVLALGVPGRPKNYTVTTKINGFTAKIIVKARSQAEADKMVLGEEAVSSIG